jgi:hypothetical protein
MRRWAPVAAALSVIAVVVAVSLVFGRGPGGDPPPLRLAAGAGTDTTMAADAPMATSGKRAAGGSSFELTGQLPSGPDEARAHPLPREAADEDAVRRLADALGIKDAPRRVERAWQAGILRVEDVAGNPWSMYVGCGPDQPVSSDGAVSICSSGPIAVGGGSSGSSGSASSGSASSGSASSGSATTPNTTMPDAPAIPPPAPEPAPAISPCPDNARCAKPPLVTPVLPPPPSIAAADIEAARRAAEVVLDKLGLSDADVSANGAGERVFVQAEPRVSGLRTWGYATGLEIDAENQVVGGNGYLGRPETGASYPLISAKEAFDDLPEMPRTLMACAPNADCPQPVPAKVTGAELGLQLTALADDEAALLPAWLFTVEDWPMPLAQPAIEPRFLQLPKDEPVKVDPGLVDPVPPAPPVQVDPAGPRSSFGFDAVFPTDEPNVIVVQYGDSGSCPHTTVEPVVKEGADSIVVLLEGDTQSTKQACTDDYRQQLVTLKLEAPLGDRTVIDGSRGEPVAVDRTCARPMGQPPAPKSCKG